MKKISIFITLLLSSIIGVCQSVNIGDILCTDGSTVKPEQYAASGKTAEGIIFFVDNSGQQGWAVSLECQATNTNWVSSGHYGDMYDIPGLVNYEYSRDALYDFDGYNNTAIIRNTHGSSWYPAAWAVDFDHGWYLPAAGQLRWMMAYINEINTSLAVVHGSTFVFDHPRWYWTSNERTGAHAVVISQTGSVGNYPKWNYIGEYEIGVRAVKNFSLHSSVHHIGELVTAPGGQKGVVFYVSPEDGSYWLAALNDLSSTYIWGPSTNIASLVNYNENDQYVRLHGVHCGYDATRDIRNTIGTASQYASSHIDFANGWHIPSAGQLSKLFAALPFIESSFSNNGGSTLSNNYYWTSTECSASKAWSINCGANLYTEGLLTARDKSNSYSVRPIWSEPCSLTPTPPTPQLPDNIIENNCNLNSPIPFYEGRLMYQTTADVNIYSTPVCGDIDNDGLVDIVVARYTNTSDYYKRHFSNAIGVYSGNDLTLQNIITIPQEIYLQYCPYGLVRYPKDDGTIQGAIVAVCCDDKLRSYSRTGQLLNTSDYEVPCHGTPSFADFNHDGYPEVYIGNAVYDAATLKLLCQGPTNGNKGLSHRGSNPGTYNHRTYNAIPFAYDVIGDEKMELICGNTIYNVNIVSRTNPSLNSITVNKTITPPSGYPQDGQVVIADLDLDGKVEVLLVNDPTYDNTANDIFYYAYKPSTGQILFSFTHYGRGTNYPAVCNIDNDPYPEILLTDYLHNVPDERMYCMRYAPGTGLNTIWSTHHNDPSGMTTMAFFDFNLDEIPEIVYRDGYNLNIINGQNGQIQYSYPMYSGTASEHPIVADVNSDGHAEIIIGGFLDYDYGVNGYGSLTMFGNENWPMTRHVWNQFAYNVTNINDDLTVPAVCFDNATVFSSNDGTIRRPYNNFMQQAGYITPTGEPYNPSGYVEAEHFGESCESYTYHGVTYTQSGDYEFLIENPLGCDTLMTVHVQIGDTIHTTVYKSECTTPYLWNGIPYSESGTYEQTFTSSQGCDSIVTLYLNIGDQVFNYIAVSTCDNYTWNGTTYDQTGTYSQTFPAASGCDSIVILDLTIKNSAHVGQIHGESLIYYQDFGTYTYSIDTVPGCFGYEWSIDGPWALEYSSDSPECSVNIFSAGSANLKVRVYTECGFIERTLHIKHDAQPGVVIYPNPTRGEFNIVLSGMKGDAVILIYDYLGNFIDRYDVDTDLEGTIIPCSLAGKAAGLYLVSVYNHFEHITRKVIKSTAASYGIYFWEW